MACLSWNEFLFSAKKGNRKKATRLGIYIKVGYLIIVEKQKINLKNYQYTHHDPNKKVMWHLTNDGSDKNYKK